MKQALAEWHEAYKAFQAASRNLDKSVQRSLRQCKTVEQLQRLAEKLPRRGYSKVQRVYHRMLQIEEHGPDAP